MRKSDTKTTKRPMIKRNRPCVLVHRSVEESVDEDTMCLYRWDSQRGARVLARLHMSQIS